MCTTTPAPLSEPSASFRDWRERHSAFCCGRGGAVPKGVWYFPFWLEGVITAHHIQPHTPFSGSHEGTSHTLLHYWALSNRPPNHSDCWVLTGTIDSHSRLFHGETHADDAGGFVPLSAEVSFVARQELGNLRFIKSSVSPPLLDRTIRHSGKFCFLSTHFIMHIWRRQRKRLPMDHNLIWCIFLRASSCLTFNPVSVNILQYSFFYSNCLDSSCFNQWVLLI